MANNCYVAPEKNVSPYKQESLGSRIKECMMLKNDIFAPHAHRQNKTDSLKYFTRQQQPSTEITTAMGMALPPPEEKKR